MAEKHAKHAEAAQVVMAPISEAVVPHFPARVWEDMSPQFCTTFWSLTMYDLYVPEHLYEKEIKKLKEAPAKLIENKDLNSARRKKEADRLNTLMERLQVFICHMHVVQQFNTFLYIGRREETQGARRESDGQTETRKRQLVPQPREPLQT